ncbi:MULTISPECIES: PadR family transcriptional regulator [Streptosporangium]|uniref:DNA-binding PadR family transcriptional regulator n=1 Tax=Streptosporangium brasiliense TaxID=47480 RepID=A0ABT9RFT2_9ACTN|nr:PadR family transcriptional regulator [Streptosporangium brasiliense]MDP9868110.1 DNA-binding PadR family transcriptional regulator [Streptosporangium brasiliense]
MSLRHALLGLLAQGPASGYDLLKVFEISLANVWPATQSQVYAELARLADADLVKVAAGGPRGRKEYSIAERGLAELRHWLTEVEPARTGRSEMLLRVFFLGQTHPDQARGYLRREAEVAERQRERLAALKQVVEREESDLSVYGRLALEWGLRFSAMQREWAEWAGGQIGGGVGPEPADPSGPVALSDPAGPQGDRGHPS